MSGKESLFLPTELDFISIFGNIAVKRSKIINPIRRREIPTEKKSSDKRDPFSLPKLRECNDSNQSGFMAKKHVWISIHIAEITSKRKKSGSKSVNKIKQNESTTKEFVCENQTYHDNIEGETLCTESKKIWAL
jgi:hypothetical protein